MAEQTTIDPFREMNRYDERDEDWPSAAVYEPPRRTLDNDWKKFHADRDCGARVFYIENTTSSMVNSDKYEYRLRCRHCGYEVPEEEVLFIGGEWFNKHGWREYGRTLDDLNLRKERVLRLGPDPDQDELRHVLNLSRIEREGNGVNGISFGRGTWYECDECGHETPLTFDGYCRMCYVGEHDGEWTDRMQGSVKALARSIRERNGSFVHRLPNHVDPIEPGGSLLKGIILWRRCDDEDVPKIVEVVQRFKDRDTGHSEYILADPEHTEEWRYTEDELAEAFWDTGIWHRESGEAVENDEIRNLWNRLQEK